MKVELMRVDGKLTLNTPNVVPLGKQIGFSGEFRIGIRPITGQTIYIYEAGTPEKFARKSV